MVALPHDFFKEVSFFSTKKKENKIMKIKQKKNVTFDRVVQCFALMFV